MVVKACLMELYTIADGCDLATFDRFRFPVPVESIDAQNDICWRPLSDVQGTAIGNIKLNREGVTAFHEPNVSYLQWQRNYTCLCAILLTKRVLF